LCENGIWHSLVFHLKKTINLTKYFFLKKGGMPDAIFTQSRILGGVWGFQTVAL